MRPAYPTEWLRNKNQRNTNCIEQTARDGILNGARSIHFCSHFATVRRSTYTLCVIRSANNWIGCSVRGPKSTKSARRVVAFSSHSAESLGARASLVTAPHSLNYSLARARLSLTKGPRDERTCAPWALPPRPSTRSSTSRRATPRTTTRYSAATSRRRWVEKPKRIWNLKASLLEWKLRVLLNVCLRVDLHFHRCADRSSKSAPSTRQRPCSCTLTRTTVTKRVRPSSNY